MQEKKKPQKIAVLGYSDETDNFPLSAAIQLANLFRKELLIVHSCKRTNQTKESKSNWKKEWTDFLSKEHKGLKFDFLELSSSSKNLHKNLADEKEVIILVAQKEHFKKHIRSFSSSPIPFLLVNCEHGSNLEFNKVVLGVDKYKHSLETAIWASHFGKFAQAEVTVIAARHKKESENDQIDKNALLARRLFEKLDVSNKLIRGNQPSWKNVKETLAYAEKQEAGIFLFTGSKTITWLDRLVGLPELAILEEAGHLPKMIVNPRVDNYMLCDG